VVGRLVESGALDDERFARRFAEDKRELAGWGPERISDALRARGIDPAAAEDAAMEEGHEAQLARALGLLRSRAVRVDSEGERARALGLLARRGFPLQLAYAAIRELEAET
jgi:regulatory protein